MFLLDTNVVSELRKAKTGKAHPRVTAWAQGTPTSSLFTSTVVIHELELGVLLAERVDPSRGSVLRRWLAEYVVPSFSDRILPLDIVVARVAAALHVPDPAPARDAFIGATALVHGLTLATRNVRAFGRFGDLAVLNPWDWQ